MTFNGDACKSYLHCVEIFKKLRFKNSAIENPAPATALCSSSSWRLNGESARHNRAHSAESSCDSVLLSVVLAGRPVLQSHGQQRSSQAPLCPGANQLALRCYRNAGGDGSWLSILSECQAQTGPPARIQSVQIVVHPLGDYISCGICNSIPTGLHLL